MAKRKKKSAEHKSKRRVTTAQKNPIFKKKLNVASTITLKNEFPKIKNAAKVASLISGIQKKGFNVDVKEAFFSGKPLFFIPEILRKYVSETDFIEAGTLFLKSFKDDDRRKTRRVTTALKNPIPQYIIQGKFKSYRPYVIKGRFQGKKGDWYLGLMGGFTNMLKYAEEFNSIDAAKNHARRLLKQWKKSYPSLLHVSFEQRSGFLGHK